MALQMLNLALKAWPFCGEGEPEEVAGLGEKIIRRLEEVS